MSARLSINAASNNQLENYSSLDVSADEHSWSLIKRLATLSNPIINAEILLQTSSQKIAEQLNVPLSDIQVNLYKFNN